MKRCLVLACLASIAAAAGVRTLAKVGLLDAGFGPTTLLLSGAYPPAVLPFALGDVALGVMVSDRVGVGLGTSILAGNVLLDLSSFPVRGYVFYDLSPGHRWRRGTGFFSASYVHSGTNGEGDTPAHPYWKLTCGASYTWYAVTPHAELEYDWHERFATLTAGIAVGGTYVSR